MSRRLWIGGTFTFPLLVLRDWFNRIGAAALVERPGWPDCRFIFQLAGEAEPAVEVVKDAADFFGGAIGGGGDGADALMEEMALEADVDIFFAEAERVLEEGDDQ